MAWIIGAFLICPCHLPFTLWLAATLLSGTATGALLLGHPYVAGAAITLVWLTATGRGIRHIQAVRQARAEMNHGAPLPAPMRPGRNVGKD